VLVSLKACVVAGVAASVVVCVAVCVAVELGGDIIDFQMMVVCCLCLDSIFRCCSTCCSVCCIGSCWCKHPNRSRCTVFV